MLRFVPQKKGIVVRSVLKTIDSKLTSQHSNYVCARNDVGRRVKMPHSHLIPLLYRCLRFVFSIVYKQYVHGISFENVYCIIMTSVCCFINPPQKIYIYISDIHRYYYYHLPVLLSWLFLLLLDAILSSDCTTKSHHILRPNAFRHHRPAHTTIPFILRRLHETIGELKTNCKR